MEEGVCRELASSAEKKRRAWRQAACRSVARTPPRSESRLVADEVATSAESKIEMVCIALGRG